MSTPKPTSTFLLLALTTLLLLTSTQTQTEEQQQDRTELDELLALDDDVTQQDHEVKSSSSAFSDAEVLSKAQRIVLELNHDNTKRVIESNEFVLILGYAPWCARSAELMPQFSEAATELSGLGSPVLMAKIDGERHSKAAAAIGVKGFPTLLLFVNGTSQVYTGGFSAEEIVIWARKKTGDSVIRVSSVPAAEEFLKKHHLFVVGLFEKFEGPQYEEFVKAATADNAIQFVEVSDIGVANVLFPNVKQANIFLGLVKSEAERYTAYDGTFEMEQILKFLDYNKFPLVNRLTESNSATVYSSPLKLQVIVFAEEDEFKKLLEPLQDAARQFKSEVHMNELNMKQLNELYRATADIITLLILIMFIYMDITDDNLAKPYLTLFGLEEINSTVVVAFDVRVNAKYLLESTLTESNIKEFCSGLLHGTLSPHFKSQPIPNNTNETVHVVVGKTFNDLILNSNKNVLLEVFTPWCMTCEATSKRVEKLANHFKNLDNLFFGKIDASVNEHPKLKVDDYPTLLFYTANDKENPIKLSTKTNLKDLAKSISKHVKAKYEAVKDEL